jgi:hypothetical protein
MLFQQMSFSVKNPPIPKLLRFRDNVKMVIRSQGLGSPPATLWANQIKVKDSLYSIFSMFN